MFAWMWRIVLIVIVAYISAGFILPLINMLFWPIVCSASDVMFYIIQYKAYLDTMFPISMWVLKLIFSAYIIFYLYNKLISWFWWWTWEEKTWKTE